MLIGGRRIEESERSRRSFEIAEAVHSQPTSISPTLGRRIRRDGVRASAVRSVQPGAVAFTAEAGRLLAGMAAESRLRLVELLPAAGAAR